LEEGFRHRSREEKDEHEKEKVIQIRRVTKVVKGGKRMSFRAVVVVGDANGKVGLGVGKAGEVAAAIRKGVEQAKKSYITVPRIGSTLPHEIESSMGASTVLLRPAPKGTGVIAGGAVRTVLELGGVSDVVAKSLGSPNAINTAKATISALSSLRKLDEEEQIRGKKLDVRFVQRQD
jgi:small subunit ribosomal protein S5